MKDYQGESFLNRLYKDLHISDEVMHTANSSDTKDEKVKKYLDRLEKTEELAKNSKYNGIELLKEMYYKKYVIKPENVPESYFEMQKKMALERGFGHVNITKEERKQMIDVIINDQKKSLDIWLDYFLSGDALYPEWFKYYAFQGMLKLGSYDKSKGSFNKRTDKTVNVFVDLNREALALVYDNLCSVLDGKQVDDEVLQKLLEGGSFSKLYAYMLNKLDGDKYIADSNDGIWIKYDKGSEPKKLVKSLEGKGTGWCTAGIETARIQLQGGDFYVYYTKDTSGDYKQPRIAIRMEDNKIGEIRGIADHQNLESEMEEVLDEKLEEFPDKDKYKKKVNDMETLTNIYNEYRNRDLTSDELRFLYEVDNKIDGFGYQKDPRIREILVNRNFKKDLAKVFNCSEDEISDDKRDLFTDKKFICFYGNLDLGMLIDTEGLLLPNIIIGNLNLNSLISVKGLKLPNVINGHLYLSSLISTEGLVLPEIMNGSLYLTNLENAEGLVLPENINDSLYLSSLTSDKNLVLPKTINGCLDLGRVMCAENLLLPEIMNGNVYLNNLRSAENVVLPKEINGDLYLTGLKSTNGLILPKNINGDLHLSSLKRIEGLELPKAINGSLNLRCLISTEGLILPENIKGSLYLNSLTSAEGLVLPQNIGGSLYLDNLTDAIGLVIPENINGDLFFDKLIKAEGLVFPKCIHGSLNLNGLQTCYGLELPEKIDGNLDMCGIRNIDSLKFPEIIGGSLILSNLIYIKDGLFPRKIKKDLYLESLEVAEDFVFPEVVGGDLHLCELRRAKNVTFPRIIYGYLEMSWLYSTEGLIVPEDFKCSRLLNNYITIQDLVNKSLEKCEQNKKRRGFSKFGILVIINVLVIIGIIFIGCLFMV